MNGDSAEDNALSDNLDGASLSDFGSEQTDSSQVLLQAAAPSWQPQPISKEELQEYARLCKSLQKDEDTNLSMHLFTSYEISKAETVYRRKRAPGTTQPSVSRVPPVSTVPPVSRAPLGTSTKPIILDGIGSNADQDSTADTTVALTKSNSLPVIRRRRPWVNWPLEPRFVPRPRPRLALDSAQPDNVFVSYEDAIKCEIEATVIRLANKYIARLEGPLEPILDDDLPDQVKREIVPNTLDILRDDLLGKVAETRIRQNPRKLKTLLSWQDLFRIIEQGNTAIPENVLARAHDRCKNMFIQT